MCGETDRGGRGDGKVLVLSPGKQIEDVGLDFKADRNLWEFSKPRLAEIIRAERGGPRRKEFYPSPTILTVKTSIETDRGSGQKGRRRIQESECSECCR